MNKIWLKIQSVRSWMLVAVVLLFALSGNARATVFISWDFNNTPQVVSPTDIIVMTASATSDGFGISNTNGEIFISSFNALSLGDGNLIGPGGQYSLALNSGSFTLNTIPAYNGVFEFDFGTLTPNSGAAPPGEFTSGLGTVEFTFSDAYASVVVTGGNTFTVNVVPEPSTIILLSLGLAGLGFVRRRKKAA